MVRIVRQIRLSSATNGNQLEYPYFDYPDDPSPEIMVNDGLDSPDIFHLRAPLVSWENFMTPATSKENMILIEK